MQRHGWAFVIGLFAINLAAAQPPSDLERYPPPPELPGEVVGQLQGGRAVSKTLPASAQDAKPPAAPGQLMPLAEGIAAPAVTTLPPTQPTLPEFDAGPPCEMNKGCKRGHAGAITAKLQAWLCFRSQAKQSGHYVTPYCPPLQAWFPCKPDGSSCANCMPAYPLGPLPPVTAPTPVEAPPLGPAPKMTRMPRPLPQATTAPSGELLPGFRKVDAGLSFAPGTAPMATPTAQIERVSTWRPK